MIKYFFENEKIQVLKKDGLILTIQFKNGDVEHVPSTELTPMRWVSSEGLSALITAGKTEFDGEVGNGADLPHNLAHGAGRLNLVSAAGVSNDPGRYGRYLPKEEADQLIGLTARMGGWLKAAGKLPAVKKLLCKTQSKQGVNSPYTFFSLATFVTRFPSPGGLERKLWATKIRAEGILSAYHGGVKPSWKNIGFALMGEARIGKAAIIAAALQLGWDGSPTHQDTTEGSVYTGPDAKGKGYGKWPSPYRGAREWLIATRTTAFPKTLEGGFRYQAEPLLSKMGTCVYAGIKIGRFGERAKVLVTIKGDQSSIAEGHYTPRTALKKAVGEWKIYKETSSLLVEKISLHHWCGEYQKGEWDEVSFDTEIRLSLRLSTRTSFLIIRKEGIRDYRVYPRDDRWGYIYFPTKGKEEEFFWRVYESFKNTSPLNGEEIKRFLTEPLGHLAKGIQPLDFREEIPENPKKESLIGTVKLFGEFDLSELFDD